MLPPANPEFSNPRCYARRLGDCSPTITKEHPLSQSLLRAFGASVRLSGTPWLKAGASVNLPPKDIMPSNVLCERHNSLLSPYDEQAGAFFEAVLNYDRRAREPDPRPFYDCRIFSGHLLELWLLKLLVGLVASGNVGKDRNIDWQPPEPWLHLLFRKADWPRGLGMYAGSRKAGFVVDRPQSIEFQLLFHRDNEEPSGAVVLLQGVRMLLATTLVPDTSAPSPFEGTIYRPEQFRFDDFGTIDLRWFQHFTQKQVKIRIKKYDRKGEG